MGPWSAPTTLSSCSAAASAIPPPTPSSSPPPPPHPPPPGEQDHANTGAEGGGLDAPAAFTGRLLLVNYTINANFATKGGGIFWAGAAGSTFSLENTIVARNLLAAGGIGPDAASPLLFTATLNA